MYKQVLLAGLKFGIHFKNSDTSKYFSKFIVCEESNQYDVEVSDEDLDLYPLICPDRKLTPFAEQYMLMARTSAYLMGFNRILIHGVSITLKNRAWIITAPSGTGKTTQYLNLKNLYNKEIEIINGDKSILQICDNNKILVHPSPWTGKEGFEGTKVAELAGIIYLEQSEENSVTLLKPHQSVLRIFDEFLILCETEKEIKKAAEIEEDILKNIPVWLLKNTGNMESSKLMHDTLLQYLSEYHEEI